MKVPWLRKRTELMPELVELGKAIDDLKATMEPVVVPPLEAIVKWLDRQLQRSPRLIRWLSR